MTALLDPDAETTRVFAMQNEPEFIVQYPGGQVVGIGPQGSEVAVPIGGGRGQGDGDA